jgi:hypothetical protein
MLEKFMGNEHLPSEERLAALEREVAALKAILLRNATWLVSAGAFFDTYGKQQTEALRETK